MGGRRRKYQVTMDKYQGEVGELKSPFSPPFSKGETGWGKSPLIPPYKGGRQIGLRH